MKNIKVIILSLIIISSVLFILYESNKSTDEYLYGVTIGIIDAGFYTIHPAFAKTRIIKQLDFVTNKPTTLNYNHIRGLDHGTNVLSVVGGYKVNEIIGIAYGANFILAKTDISTDRLSKEEVNAVAASKWLSENGADIITTSLSFNKFDNAPYYYPSQMNGKTALITRTADSIAGSGILYVSSAGNNYEEDWHIIEPPGDGFNVLTVGSIDKNLIHSFFSSCGPTVDGRIKPDIVAPGEGVWVANYLPKIKNPFGWSHGTSLAAPIAAGIAALVLSAHPELASKQVYEAIKYSASRSNNPDNLYGWGVPDAEKVVTYFGPAFSNTPEVDENHEGFVITTYVISSYGLVKPEVKFHLMQNNSYNDSVYIMKEIDENRYACTISNNLTKNGLKFYFEAKDIRGRKTKYPSGKLGNYFNLRKNKEGKEIVIQ